MLFFTSPWLPCSYQFVYFINIYLFLERWKREAEREGERNIGWLPSTGPWWGTGSTTQACALTRNQTNDLSILGLTLNQATMTNLYFLIPWPFPSTSPSPFYSATVKMFSVSVSLFLFCLYAHSVFDSVMDIYKFIAISFFILLIFPPF